MGEFCRILAQDSVDQYSKLTFAIFVLYLFAGLVVI